MLYGRRGGVICSMIGEGGSYGMVREGGLYVMLWYRKRRGHIF